MHFLEILEKKRDRKPLTKAEIGFFIDGLTKGQIPDYQASALLMAIFLNGLSADETAWLTESMLYSGSVVDLSQIPGTKVDKHSTGGVGDKASLIVAPICAALNVPIPMISGRGLGHTGGTLDKLEAIPGFNVNLDLNRYREIIGKTGLCLIGQTKEIAPADKKLYALRDVTATVANQSLIAASIMSKKMAEGIDGLVLDVKSGKGAFMERLSDAEALAGLMISIGRKMNKRITALITDMNQPLGTHIGNALEVIESVMILKGDNQLARTDLVELSKSLAAHMIRLGDKTDSLDLALEMVQKSIDDGSAFEKFKEIVREQGGDEKSLDDFSRLPTAAKSHALVVAERGFIKSLDALAIGRGSVVLGAGRQTLASVIDPAVGVILKKKIGDKVEAGEMVMEIKYNDDKKLADALPHFQGSITIGETTVPTPMVIIKTLGDI
ncbi:MAG: thymidine phosphorylase [Deltaproteobacteria bacterium]|nr:thymidine phosphorylase [Deltaproteobacteria bacterium]